MEKTRLYIGIETKVREFDAKLLLACVAAEAGYDVVLGEQKDFIKYLDEMPQGILINKSISPSKASQYLHYNKLGFRLAAYDEEGLAPFNAEEYKKRRISVASLHQLACFFAWGQWQAQVIAEQAPDEMEKVVLVGHPRVDLTRRELRAFYQDEVQALRDKYGQFVLINTNFSFYNHFKGRDFKIILQEKTKAGKVVDAEHREYYWRVSKHKKALFYAFQNMVEQLHRHFPEVVITLRPHPSENHDYWREVLPKADNIQVVHEGNVLSWILASAVMIHNSCTTGIEGFLLEHPVISYRPVQEADLEFELPNLLSEQEFAMDTLLERVGAYIKNDPGQSLTMDGQKKEIAGQYITGLDGPLSCERIVERLNMVKLPEPSLGLKGYSLYTRLKRTKGAFIQMLSRPSQVDPRQGYRQQKFPGFDVEEVRRGIAKLQRVSGRFPEVEAVPIAKNTVQIIRRSANTA